MTVKNPLFKPGQILATPGFLVALEKSGQSFMEFLQRHLAGDWGVVCAEDAEANNQALKDGSRLLSAYVLKDAAATKVWLITEAEDDIGNRAATTGLLPSEY
jgi:hypothetical protein